MSSIENTNVSGENQVTDPASVNTFVNNPTDGIDGPLSNLADQAICSEFTTTLAPEQQLLDDIISIINTDNGDDAVFVESVTSAMEDYLDEAHPAMVQAIYSMIEMVHLSNEELVEWSILKAARDAMEARKAELDTCLDEKRDEGLNKVLSRLSQLVDANAPAVTLSYLQGLQSPETASVDVKMDDGSGGVIQSTIDISSLAVAIQKLAAVRVAGDQAFLAATQAATVTWSEKFKREFMFEYDSSRAADQEDVDYAQSLDPQSTLALQDPLGLDALYMLSSDESGDISGTANPGAYWYAGGETGDDYAPATIQPHGVGGPIGARISVGDAFPVGSLDHAGADIAGKIYGGGIDEFKVQVLGRHRLKLDQQGDFERR